MKFDLGIVIAMLVIGSYGVYEMSTSPLSRPDEPVGAGGYAISLSIILLLLSLWQLQKLLTGKMQSKSSAIETLESVIEERRDNTSSPWLRSVVMLLAIGVYTGLFTIVGFIESTFAFMLVLSYVLDQRQLWKKVLFSISLSIAAWWIFGTLLRLPLPSGILG